MVAEAVLPVPPVNNHGRQLADGDQKASVLAPDLRSSGFSLSAVEREVIAFFVQLARIFGSPRSVGEIYGMLFVSHRPLSMDDLMERLCISKGSASQGLRFLRDFGAIEMTYVENDRRIHYQAVAELRNLAGRFVRDRIVPHLDNSINRLDRISTMVKQLPPAERGPLSKRIALLQSWEKNSRRMIPVVTRLLG